MKGSRWRSKYWQWANLCTILVVVAFMGVFYQPWRVHAFDLQKAAASVSHAVAQVAPQPLANTPIVAAPTLTPAAPDRWSDGDVVSALSSFYQSIIACLGLLLALVGVLAVVTLRFLSKAAAEDIAHESAKAAMRHYLDTRRFQEVVDYAVREAMQETEIAKQLERLEVEKEAVAKQLDQLTGDLQAVKQKLKEQQEQMPNNAPVGDPPPPHDDNEDVEGEVTPAPVAAPAPDPQGGGN